MRDEDLIERLRRLADEVGRVYGSPDPPDDELRLGDLAYFVMHEAASEIETLRRRPPN